MNFFEKILKDIQIGKPKLGEFQRKKVAHEFTTFVDIRKVGRLQWKDFENLQEHVLKLSAWKADSEPMKKCKETILELWTLLVEKTGEKEKGQVTVDTWIALWTDVVALKLEPKDTKESNKTKKTLKSEVPEPGTVPNGDVAEGNTEAVTPSDTVVDEFPQHLPSWVRNYCQFKFSLFDRSADGDIDLEEFEYVLYDGFEIAPQNCRDAFKQLSQHGEKKVTYPVFQQLFLQFYFSEEPKDAGNFLNGQLEYN